MKLLTDPNHFIGTPYDKDIFHCWHLIESCLEVPTLKDISVDTVVNDVAKYKDLFMEIETPIDYCIMMLGDTHIGIYCQNGAFHNDIHGTRWESMRNLKLKYKDIKYYDIH